MKSLWNDTVQLPRFPQLEQDIQTDVLIIGGGMAGILCASMLAREGIDYALVESDRICGKITGNTTAKITWQHGLIYDRLCREWGTERARLYLEANRAALKRYEELSREIPCDFEIKDAYVYSPDKPEKLERELAAYEKLGIPAVYRKDLPLPFSTVGAVCAEKQAQFHPLKFVSGLVENLNIYENTPVHGYDGRRMVTPHGSITASHTIVATHFPIFNKHGAYFLKMYQHRSYVLALDDAPAPDGMYVDEAETGLSFRSWQGRLLLGGGGHRTGKSGGSWNELRTFAKQHYPNARETHHWAAQDCMTLDGMPYIGEYAKRTPALYTATGFNKWGMTSSMVSAMVLTDLIQGRTNDYAQLFSPSRTMLRPQLFANILESGLHLLTPTTPRCPHMGCALKWNRQERSWDCPCHGSRFAEDGRLLDTPATADRTPPEKKPPS